ncbi:MAG: hypothetical protein ACYSU5_14270 [Planctomycetota bacterium]|jgi:aspartate racemase
MAKHIGIVACSAEGAALCYRTICAEGASLMGKHRHPEITMHTYPLSEYMVYIRTGEWEKVGELMIRSAGIVAEAGADFVICPHLFPGCISQKWSLQKPEKGNLRIWVS